MFGIAFLGVLLATALYAANWARKAWRDPDNWYIDPDDKHLAFDRWPELVLIGALCLAVLADLLAGFRF